MASIIHAMPCMQQHEANGISISLKRLFVLLTTPCINIYMVMDSMKCKIFDSEHLIAVWAGLCIYIVSMDKLTASFRAATGWLERRWMAEADQGRGRYGGDNYERPQNEMYACEPQEDISQLL